MKDEIQYQLKKKIDLTKKASDYFSLFDKIVSEEKFSHSYTETEKEGIIQEALVETIGCTGMTHSAAMAAEIPMAEDLTAEADSGGHTDNRPALTLLPTMLALRDEISGWA